MIRHGYYIVLLRVLEMGSGGRQHNNAVFIAEINACFRGRLYNANAP